MDVLGLADELIDAADEFSPRRVRTSQDQFLSVRGKELLLRSPCPAPKVAVHEKGQPAEVLATSGIPKVAEDVLEMEFACFLAHAALQHNFDA